jgi:hypothetical protein
MDGKIVNAILVQCDHCKDWFEPKVFTTKDLISFIESNLTKPFNFEEQYVICTYCNEKTFASFDKTKGI